jgi:NADPH:quinone reductase-like Zn-dependent oxidoreductase
MKSAIYDRHSPQGVNIIQNDSIPTTNPSLLQTHALVKVMAAGINPVDAKVTFLNTYIHSIC